MWNTYKLHFSCAGPFSSKDERLQFKNVLKRHKSMTGGTGSNSQMISDATATYDLTGHYLSNEKEGQGK